MSSCYGVACGCSLAVRCCPAWLAASDARMGPAVHSSILLVRPRHSSWLSVAGKLPMGARCCPGCRCLHLKLQTLDPQPVSFTPAEKAAGRAYAKRQPQPHVECTCTPLPLQGQHPESSWYSLVWTDAWDVHLPPCLAWTLRAAWITKQLLNGFLVQCHESCVLRMTSILDLHSVTMLACIIHGHPPQPAAPGSLVSLTVLSAKP